MANASPDGLKNIGPKTRLWLHEIGIDTLADLEALGAVEVYKRLKAARPQQVSLNALWGLQGAILNIHWNALPPDMKDDLKAQVDSADPIIGSIDGGKHRQTRK